jgi:hypothetical protein
VYLSCNVYLVCVSDLGCVCVAMQCVLVCVEVCVYLFECK